MSSISEPGGSCHEFQTPRRDLAPRRRVPAARQRPSRTGEGPPERASVDGRRPRHRPARQAPPCRHRRHGPHSRRGPGLAASCRRAVAGRAGQRRDALQRRLDHQDGHGRDDPAPRGPGSPDSRRVHGDLLDRSRSGQRPARGAAHAAHGVEPHDRTAQLAFLPARRQAGLPADARPALRLFRRRPGLRRPLRRAETLRVLPRPRRRNRLQADRNDPQQHRGASRRHRNDRTPRRRRRRLPRLLLPSSGQGRVPSRGKLCRRRRHGHDGGRLRGLPARRGRRRGLWPGPSRRS